MYILKFLMLWIHTLTLALPAPLIRCDLQLPWGGTSEVAGDAWVSNAIRTPQDCHVYQPEIIWVLYIIGASFHFYGTDRTTSYVFAFAHLDDSICYIGHFHDIKPQLKSESRGDPMLQKRESLRLLTCRIVGCK
jgi:hypothetical protein